MSRRGHSLMLILIVLAMSAAAGTIFMTRLSGEQHGWHEQEVRSQALWLARSALAAGVSGQRQVTTPLGPATVVVERRGGRSTAQVALQGGRASVQSEPYRERYRTEL